MERNQYKERLMELQEAVRWTGKELACVTLDSVGNTCNNYMKLLIIRDVTGSDLVNGIATRLLVIKWLQKESSRSGSCMKIKRFRIRAVCFV